MKILLVFISLIIASINANANAKAIDSKLMNEYVRIVHRVNETTCNRELPCGWYVIDDQTLGFRGEIIFNQTAKEFKKLYSKNKIKTLIVNSIGGSIVDGVKIGQVIKDDQLNVIVDGVCMSSCANYWFLLAKEKEINGMVAFHGGVTSSTQTELWGGTLNPLFYIGKYFAKKKEKVPFINNEKLLTFINQTGSGPKGEDEWTVATKTELEKITLTKIKGEIDGRYICIMERVFEKNQENYVFSNASKKLSGNCEINNVININKK